MQCVKCGKKNAVIDGECVECFLKGKEIVSIPQSIDLERCTNCDEFRMNGHWVPETLVRTIEDSALDHLTWIREARSASASASVFELDPRNFLVKIEAEADVEGTVVTSTVSTTVRLKNTVCKRCSRQLGNYYEATLQIRTGSKTLSDEMRDEIVRRVRFDVDTMSKNNRDLFITKVEEVSGGIDFLLSSISMGRTLARDIADAYGGEYKESSKLVGMNEDGCEMYRLTYLVRLPDYKTGDVIKHNNTLYKITWVGKNGAKVIRLSDFRETTIKRNDMSSIKVAVRSEDLDDAVVITRSQKEIQVLHPMTQATVDLRIPEDAEIGDTVKVALVDDDILFVP